MMDRLTKKPSNLGIYIKDFRKKKHLSQKGLAQLSKKAAKPGFSKQFVSCIESGFRKRVYNFGILKSISKILNLSLSHVYKLNGYPQYQLTPSQKYGLNLKKALTKKHLSALNVAKALNISTSTIRKWEYGISRPSFQNELMLIIKFHINPECLDTRSNHQLHQFFHSPGCQKFKLLRINNNWNLNDVYNITGIHNMMLLRVENGQSFNFNIIYKLSRLYHIRIRQVTNHKFSLYQIHKYIINNGSRLEVIRELQNKSLNSVQEQLSNTVSLSKVEHNKQPVSLSLIGDLSMIYGIPFKPLLYLVDYSVTNNYEQKEIGHRLRTVREHNHLNQPSIEKLTHGIISKAALSRWETGGTKLSLSKMPYLAKAMCVPIQNLLNQLGFQINHSENNLTPKNLEHYKI